MEESNTEVSHRTGVKYNDPLQDEHALLRINIFLLKLHKYVIVQEHISYKNC